MRGVLWSLSSHLLCDESLSSYSVPFILRLPAPRASRDGWRTLLLAPMLHFFSLAQLSHFLSFLPLDKAAGS